MRLVSTDGHRVAMATTVAKWPKGAPDVIVPIRLAELIAGCGKGSLQWNDALMRFQSGPVTITGKMIDGSFPDYRRLFSNITGDPYAFDAEAMLGAIRRVRIASDAQQRKLHIKRMDGRLAIRIEGTSGFEGEDEIDADCVDGFEACVNADYVVHIMAAIVDGGVAVQHDTPGSVLYIRPVTQPKDMTLEILCMPMRV